MSIHLTEDFHANADAWKAAGIAIPDFDPAAVNEYTAEHPYWVHFGAGNLFRAVHAPIAQRLIEQGVTKAGIIATDTFDGATIEQVYAPYDNRWLQVVMNADGTMDRTLIASCAAAFAANTPGEGRDKLIAVFRDPQLQFATVTITEKGYAVQTGDGEPNRGAAGDLAGTPAEAGTTMGVMTNLLYERYLAGGAPIAMVSTDNFSSNGDRFGASVKYMAGKWVESGKLPQEFLDWLNDPAKVSFPLTMIDRITPNPAQSVADRLAADGFGDTELIHTHGGTNIAPFANTEATWYLVIEDDFPNGRPDLTKAGVYLTDRDTVNKVDEMKVTTCLNPLHTALATFGMLLGKPSMADAINDPTLKALTKRLGYDEGLPVVTSPGIIDPREFIDQVVNERVPNPNIPDTPARISTDTSQKIPIRYGVTIGKYLESDGHDVNDLVAIPLVIAGWLRLLVGKDGMGTRDDGTEVKLSPDPRMADVQDALDGLTVGGDNADAEAKLRPILADATIFGTDLNATPLGARIVGYFREFAAGTGTVIPTLKKALGL